MPGKRPMSALLTDRDLRHVRRRRRGSPAPEAVDNHAADAATTDDDVDDYAARVRDDSESDADADALRAAYRPTRSEMDLAMHGFWFVFVRCRLVLVVVVVGLSICSHSSSQPDDRHRGKVAHDGDVGQTSGMGHRGRHIAARHIVGLYL